MKTLETDWWCSCNEQLYDTCLQESNMFYALRLVSLMEKSVS
jgi:hypothetical protein